MRKIIMMLLVFFMSASLSAQDRYASRMTPDGTLFFIMPHKMGKQYGIKKFEYDVTLLSWTDSATVNFTFVSPHMEIPSSLKLETCGNTIDCTSYSPLFVDLAKKNFEIRITSKFHISTIEQMVKCDTPPRIIMTQVGNEEWATYSQRSWNKDRKILSQIFELYKMQRK